MNADNLKKEIKKVKVWHVALLCAGIFLAFAIIGSIMVAAGGGWNLGKGVDFHWGDLRNIGVGQLFEVNDRGEQDLAGVDKIVIGTVSDNVTVLAGGTKVVAELKGQCRSVTKPVWLETSKTGRTLNIIVKYPNSISNNNTQLTVTIPQEYAGNLSIETVSGDIEAAGLPFRLQQVKLGAVSGHVNFNTASYARLTSTTTSGNVTISGIAAETTASSISGSVNLDYTAFAETKASSISGGVTATIPQDAKFRVEFSTVSGGFHSTHNGLNVSDADHGFSGGTSGGEALIKVNTTSGDFKLSGK